MQFLFSSLIWFVVGGLLALAVRWQLAWPWSDMPIFGNLLFAESGGQISPEFYTMLFTMHATIMIFFVIIPILAGAFGNFLIPLMIGAEDMAFPRLNMLSYWFMWPAFGCMILSFFMPGYGPSSGWTSYPPLSVLVGSAPGSGNAQTLWVLGLIFVGISSMMGSINYMTTIIQMRAPGMTMFRLPMTIWGMFITAIMQAFALPVLTAALADATFRPRLADRVFSAGEYLGQQRAGGQRRRTGLAVAAPVLVLFASGGLHHDPAGDGNGLGHHFLFFAKAVIWLPADGLFDHGHRRTGVYCLGPPHVHLRHEPHAGDVVHGFDDADRVAQWRESLQLDRHAMGRATAFDHADVVLRRFCFDVCDRRAVRHRDVRTAGRYRGSRHLLHRGASALRFVWCQRVGSVWRRSISGSRKCLAG